MKKDKKNDGWSCAVKPEIVVKCYTCQVRYDYSGYGQSSGKLSQFEILSNFDMFGLDQFRSIINRPSALMMGLMFHGKAKRLVKNRKYEDAVKVPAIGEEAFSVCDLKVVEKDSFMEISFHIPNDNTQFVGDENRPPAQVLCEEMM
ncbi:hypothetical protein L2E82_50419 [Cichorium intybus]|nr:hypothetical protein L2E82_50419 [Cichorium intybus]